MLKHIAFIITLIMLGLAAMATISSATGQSNPTPTAEILPSPEPILFDPEWQPDNTAPSPTADEIYAETEHFIIYSPDDYLPLPLEDVAVWAEETYTHVSEQLDAAIDQPIYLRFEAVSDRDCPARGAFWLAENEDGQSVPNIIAFATADTSPQQIRGVLSHETAHAIHALAVGDGISVEQGLNEGLATWASQDYWQEWLGGDSLEGLVRDYLEDDTYLSLVEWFDPYTLPPTADCIERRNIIYTELASFTGWLIDEYGMAAFINLMGSAEEVRTETHITRSRADFVDVYGLALNQLVAAWLDWVQTAAE